MTLEQITQQLFGVRKKDKRLVPFEKEKIVEALYRSYKADAEIKAESTGQELKDESLVELRKKAEELSDHVIENLTQKRVFGKFPKSKENIPDVEDIHEATIDTLRKDGYESVAERYEKYHNARLLDHQNAVVTKPIAGLNTTDKSLFVISESHEEIREFDRARIALALMKEVSVPEAQAYSIAKETESRLSHYMAIRMGRNGNGNNNNGNGQKQLSIRTAKIREVANEVMEDWGIKRTLRDKDVLTLPVYDYEQIVTGKNTENSNVLSNSPEMVAATVAEQMSRQYMLNNVFSERVSKAHLNGQIHLHDLGYGQRVYCSSHSPANIAKWGLELNNLSTTSVPARHTHTLTGHLNTFLASVQTYYAGALGVAYINDIFAPIIDNDLRKLKENKLKFLETVEKEMKDNLENIIGTGPIHEGYQDFLDGIKKTFDEIRQSDVLSDEDIDKFLKQEAQYLIFSGSQMAFSRGGQTLFLDFNIHTGTPKHIQDNPAIGPGGKYYLRRNDEMIALEERIRTEDGKQLSDLYLGNRLIMSEKFVKKGKKKELVREYQTEENEEVDTYKHHSETSRRFARALLNVFREGDGRGGVFPFPKCDLHINQETFDDPLQHETLIEACKISSENGSPYFIFDREATTLSACCRLRTTIEDDYVLKKLESLRFCGVQNVTSNAPQAAYRAGKGNREKFLDIMKETIDISIEAHLDKKKYLQSLGQKGGPQYQMKQPWKDGKSYVDLDEATYILGMLGWNDAYQYLYGKEFHEYITHPVTGEQKLVAEIALEDMAELFAYKEMKKDETGLNLKIEETPGESTCRRFAKLDYRNYKEQAKEVVKGSIENDEIYYTNSVHFRADAPKNVVNLSTRIKYQSKFHQLIEAGAIIHGFVGEERPPAESIYELIKWTWYDTQCAQVTISPEFTYCEDCKTIKPGYHFKHQKGGKK